MGNIIRILGLLIIGIGIIFTALFLNPTPTGEAIESYKYTYTKAICNKSHFCQDYLVTCNNNSVQDISPITGAITQHSKNWTDARGNSNRKDCSK